MSDVTEKVADTINTVVDKAREYGEIARLHALIKAEEAKKLVLGKIDKVFNTNGNGSIDFDDYEEDSYDLPKIVLYAVLKDVAMNEIRPVLPENREEAENLYKSI